MEQTTAALQVAAPTHEDEMEEFSIVELEERLEFAVSCDSCNNNCSCPPPPPK